LCSESDSVRAISRMAVVLPTPGRPRNSTDRLAAEQHTQARTHARGRPGRRRVAAMLGGLRHRAATAGRGAHKRLLSPPPRRRRSAAHPAGCPAPCWRAPTRRARRGTSGPPPRPCGCAGRRCGAVCLGCRLCCRCQTAPRLRRRRPGPRASPAVRGGCARARQQGGGGGAGTHTPTRAPTRARTHTQRCCAPVCP
jgi:hypothetical protein